LFQAEARRCKDIIDVIKANKKERHFCVFDELYSGTNPDEAVMSANAFMEYLVKFENVKCILTTHFIAVCKKLSSHSLIENYKMETTPTGDSFNYTYVLKKGISEVRGGIKVLHDMQYPDEIIQNSRFNNDDN
jgi:DNA mismatch repair protein MutS